MSRDPIQIHVDSSKQGETRTTTVTLTGTDWAHIQLIDSLTLVVEEGTPAKALHDALCDGTPLISKTWPPAKGSSPKCDHGYWLEGAVEVCPDGCRGNR
jgi:hypothetical protein